MNRNLLLFALVVGIVLQQCRGTRDINITEDTGLKGMEGMALRCNAKDTIWSVLVSKADAIFTFDNERYEATLTLYAKRDSIIYLSVVNSGYEMIRASVELDSIKVINRLNKIVYRTALQRRFGYQYPVSFRDVQNLISSYFLCDDLDLAHDDQEHSLLFEFDESYVKKRIVLDRERFHLQMFEFFHQKTDQYLMGERIENAFKIYSNLIIPEFEIIASGGILTYNRDLKIKMNVNRRKYTFTELR